MDDLNEFLIRLFTRNGAFWSFDTSIHTIDRRPQFFDQFGLLTYPGKAKHEGYRQCQADQDIDEHIDCQDNSCCLPPWSKRVTQNIHGYSPPTAESNNSICCLRRSSYRSRVRPFAIKTR